MLVMGREKVNPIYYLETDGSWAVIPLPSGSGTYSIQVHEKDSEKEQFPNTTVLNKSFTANLENEFLPFLYPSRIIQFSLEDEAVQLAKKLADEAGVETDLDVVEAVLDYIVENISYDTKRQRGSDGKYAYYYVDVDTVIEDKTGICYDYAVLMTAMLRSQRIPTRFIIGYSKPESKDKQLLHAWIETYIEDKGWIRQIEFRGNSWERVDPTFEAAGVTLSEQVGDGKTYEKKETH